MLHWTMRCPRGSLRPDETAAKQREDLRLRNNPGRGHGVFPKCRAAAAAKHSSLPALLGGGSVHVLAEPAHSHQPRRVSDWISLSPAGNCGAKFAGGPVRRMYGHAAERASSGKVQDT